MHCVVAFYVLLLPPRAARARLVSYCAEQDYAADGEQCSGTDQKGISGVPQWYGSTAMHVLVHTLMFPSICNVFMAVTQ